MHHLTLQAYIEMLGPSEQLQFNGFPEGQERWCYLDCQIMVCVVAFRRICTYLDCKLIITIKRQAILVSSLPIKFFFPCHIQVSISPHTYPHTHMHKHTLILMKKKTMALKIFNFSRKTPKLIYSTNKNKAMMITVQKY